MTEIDKNIKAIEEEKKSEISQSSAVDAIEREKDSYLEEHPEEDVEVEEIEFSLSEEEIDEWINELTLLKEEKTHITLSVDEDTDLKINYEGDKE